MKLIGVYRTEEAVRAAVKRLGAQPGFRDHPNVVDPEHDEDVQGFHVDRYELDEDNWTEGFLTM